MQNQNDATFGPISPAVSRDVARIRGILFTGAWVPREVRCRRCAAVAAMDHMDCLGETEIAVDYCCPDCGWQATQRFQDATQDKERFARS